MPSRTDEPAASPSPGGGVRPGMPVRLVLLLLALSGGCLWGFDEDPGCGGIDPPIMPPWPWDADPYDWGDACEPLACHAACMASDDLPGACSAGECRCGFCSGAPCDAWCASAFPDGAPPGGFCDMHGACRCNGEAPSDAGPDGDPPDVGPDVPCDDLACQIVCAEGTWRGAGDCLDGACRCGVCDRLACETYCVHYAPTGGDPFGSCASDGSCWCGHTDPPFDGGDDDAGDALPDGGEEVFEDGDGAGDGPAEASESFDGEEVWE